MPVPDRTNAPYTRNSEQAVLNKSQDIKYDVLAVELLAEDVTGTSLVRLKTDASGSLAVTGGGAGGALSTSAKGTTAAGSPTSTTASADRQPLDVTLRDTAGNSVAVGGGTQYADGAVAATPTGTAVAWNDVGTERIASAAKPLPVSLATAPTTPVTGTFYQATQPVSAVSLPLPTGAATSAAQLANNHNVVVTSAPTTAVTGPLTDTQLRATPVPISGTVTSTPSGTTTVTGTVTANIGTSGSLALDATLTGGTQKAIVRSGAKGTAVAADVTSNPISANAQLLHVDGSLVTQPVSIATMPTTPVTGTFFQATQPVSLATAPSTPVTNAGTFAVQAAATLAAETTKVIGTVNIAAAQTLATVTAVTAITNALPTGANTIGVVGQIPATLIVSTTAASGTGVTLTLPAVASQFHYITRVNIMKYAAVAVVGAAAPVTVTSTNLAGSLAWTTPTAQAIGTQYETDLQPNSPIKSSTVNTSTTIVCPAKTSIIWRVNVYYYAAA